MASANDIIEERLRRQAARDAGGAGVAPPSRNAHLEEPATTPPLPSVRPYQTTGSSHQQERPSAGSAGAASGSPKIMLGLDFGTTFTGLAWAQTDGVHPVGIDDVKLFTNWPGGSRNRKTPSELSYSRSSQRKRQWGEDIGDDSIRLIRTKLDLHPQGTFGELRRLREAIRGLDLADSLARDGGRSFKTPLEHLTRTPTEIVRDFLSYVARAFCDDIRTTTRFALDNIEVEVVITHPAEWGYEAKNQLFRAVSGAFQQNLFPSLKQFYLLPEPEAATLFTIGRMIQEDRHRLRAEDCFILCDAGGGTVDLASYKIKSLHPLELQKIGDISGAECGATAIDRKFREYLDSILPDGPTSAKTERHGQTSLSEHEAVLLRNFEIEKRRFSGTETCTMEVPEQWAEADPDCQYIREGLLTIDAPTMAKFFDFSVEQTMDLIVAHQQEIALQGEVLSEVYLSGGFSQNDHLFSRVRAWVDELPGDVRVTRPEDCWTAVAQGAVLNGLSIGASSKTPIKRCPRHYGISNVDGQVFWLVRKGDMIIPKEPIQVRFKLVGTFNRRNFRGGEPMQMSYCSTDVDKPSALFRDLPASTEIAHLDIKWQDIPEQARIEQNQNGNRFFTVAMEVRLEVSFDERVYVRVRCGDKVLVSHRAFIS